MSEENNNRIAEQNEILKKLRAIGGDFWGSAPAAAEGAAGKKPAPAKAAVPKPQPEIDKIWMTADETVDWTEALAYDMPRDGLTSPALWKFYHENAKAVLEGDIQAYARVLRHTNPLGELTPYADGITMRAPTADRLESSFTCREKLLTEKGKSYLAAMGVRIARDLLACLPAEEAGVTAYQNGEVVMDVTYPREKLERRNFRFLDPVAFTEECGARFSL